MQASAAKNHTAAIKHLTSALGRGCGGAARAYAARGDAHLALQMYGEAVQDFECALREGGEDARWRLQLGVALRYTGQYQEASEEIERVLASQPENQVLTKTKDPVH